MTAFFLKYRNIFIFIFCSFVNIVQIVLYDYLNWLYLYLCDKDPYGCKAKFSLVFTIIERICFAILFKFKLRFVFFIKNMTALILKNINIFTFILTFFIMKLYHIIITIIGGNSIYLSPRNVCLNLVWCTARFTFYYIIINLFMKTLILSLKNSYIIFISIIKKSIISKLGIIIAKLCPIKNHLSSINYCNLLGIIPITKTILNSSTVVENSFLNENQTMYSAFEPFMQLNSNYFILLLSITVIIGMCIYKYLKSTNLKPYISNFINKEVTNTDGNIINSVHSSNSHENKNNLKILPFNFIITMSYFFIFCVLLLVLRYIRLNNLIIIPIQMLFHNLPFILVFISIIVYNLQKIRSAFYQISQIKTFFWSKTILTLEIIHIKLLKYNIYFKFMEIFYKLSFIWISYINHHPNIYIKYPRSSYRNFLHLLYQKPFICNISIFISTITEIIVTKGYIYYNSYIIFIYIILKFVFMFLNNFATYPWEKSCCFADYYHLNWEHPRYPQRFWLWFHTIRNQFNNQPKLSALLEKSINTRIALVENKQKNQNKRYIKINQKINNKGPILCTRIKLAYNKWSGIRWTHTAAISTKVWHPMTALFAKNAIDYGVLLNNSWSHFKTIEKIKAQINYKEIVYQHFTNPFNNKVKISTMIEHNLITNFAAFEKRNIKVFTYNKALKTDTRNQSQDDIQIDPRNANPPIVDNRTHALDQKATPYASSIPEPSSKILSSISPMEYETVLRNFRQTFLNSTNR